MLPRVAEVIERVSGVSYHPGHVWYVLRDQLDWTWERPARRAVERNVEAIEHWVKKRWRQTEKRARRQNALIVSGSGCPFPARWCTNRMAVTPTSCSSCDLAPATMKP